jgi:hypothetical protein
MRLNLRRALALHFTALAMCSLAVSEPALAKQLSAGPVTFDVPDDFTSVSSPRPVLHQAGSEISIEVSELPPQALQEFKGQAFLEFLASVGYTDAVYASAGALKRPDAYTYVFADAKGAQGPERRFLLVIGGSGKAAIVTAYAPKSQLDNGRASQAQIETILSSATLAPPVKH